LSDEKIVKNIERKDGHPVFGNVHLHSHSKLGKLPVIEVSIAYQKYPALSPVIGASCGIQMILRRKPTVQITPKIIPILLK
tara:strand:- start:251 stop:493 length:243 start_codon:yes stop_codon:yes gene_type:complete